MLTLHQSSFYEIGAAQPRRSVTEIAPLSGMIFVAVHKLFGIVPERAAFVCGKLDI